MSRLQTWILMMGAAGFWAWMNSWPPMVVFDVAYWSAAALIVHWDSNRGESNDPTAAE